MTFGSDGQSSPQFGGSGVLPRRLSLRAAPEVGIPAIRAGPPPSPGRAGARAGAGPARRKSSHGWGPVAASVLQEKDRGQLVVAILKVRTAFAAAATAAGASFPRPPPPCRGIFMPPPPPLLSWCVRHFIRLVLCALNARYGIKVKS